MPQGYDVLELKKAMYGLVQASRQWYKTFSKFLLTLGFKKSNTDPCLFYRQSQEGFVFFPLYVDDLCLIGDQAAIDKALEHIKRKYTFKTHSIEKFNGSNFKIKDDTIFLFQEDLILTISEASPKLPTKQFTTPAKPILLMEKPEPEDYLNQTQQKKLCSGVGKLLYAIKLT